MKSMLLSITLLVGVVEAQAEYRGDYGIPDYGSAAHDRRVYQDKNYEGDRHGTPYNAPSTNFQRYQEYNSHATQQNPYGIERKQYGTPSLEYQPTVKVPGICPSGYRGC